jgi:hypothetical protein
MGSEQCDEVGLEFPGAGLEVDRIVDVRPSRSTAPTTPTPVAASAARTWPATGFSKGWAGQTASRPPWRSWRPPPDSGARGGAAAAGVSGRASRPLSTTPGSRTDAAAVDNVRLSRHSHRPARGHQPQVSPRSALTDRGRRRDDGEISSTAVAGGYRFSAGTSGPVRGPWICLLDSVTLSTRSARLPPAEETWWLSTTWSC